MMCILKLVIKMKEAINQMYAMFIKFVSNKVILDSSPLDTIQYRIILMGK